MVVPLMVQFRDGCKVICFAVGRGDLWQVTVSGICPHGLFSTYHMAQGQHPSPLSARRVRILELSAEGRQEKEIALELGISKQTVKNHITGILVCLKVNNRTAAVAKALALGWIHLPQ